MSFDSLQIVEIDVSSGTVDNSRLEYNSISSCTITFGKVTYSTITIESVSYTSLTIGDLINSHLVITEAINSTIILGCRINSTVSINNENSSIGYNCSTNVVDIATTASTTIETLTSKSPIPGTSGANRDVSQNVLTESPFEERTNATLIPHQTDNGIVNSNSSSNNGALNHTKIESLRRLYRLRKPNKY